MKKDQLKQNNRNKEIIMAREDRKLESMSNEEARKFRIAAYKPIAKTLSDQEKKEAFRQFWTKEKYKYDMGKDMEQILWLHLKAIKFNIK